MPPHSLNILDTLVNARIHISMCAILPVEIIIQLIDDVKCYTMLRS